MSPAGRRRRSCLGGLLDSVEDDARGSNHRHIDGADRAADALAKLGVNGRIDPGAGSRAGRHGGRGRVGGRQGGALVSHGPRRRQCHLRRNSGPGRHALAAVPPGLRLYRIASRRENCRQRHRPDRQRPGRGRGVSLGYQEGPIVATSPSGREAGRGSPVLAGSDLVRLAVGESVASCRLPGRRPRLPGSGPDGLPLSGATGLPGAKGVWPLFSKAPVVE